MDSVRICVGASIYVGCAGRAQGAAMFWCRPASPPLRITCFSSGWVTCSIAFSVFAQLQRWHGESFVAPNPDVVSSTQQGVVESGSVPLRLRSSPPRRCCPACDTPSTPSATRQAHGDHGRHIRGVAQAAVCQTEQRLSVPSQNKPRLTDCVGREGHSRRPRAHASVGPPRR